MSASLKTARQRRFPPAGRYHPPILWDGKHDLPGPMLRALCGISQTTLWADERAGLITGEKRPRVKPRMFKGAEILRYLKIKHPAILNQIQNTP